MLAHSERAQNSRKTDNGFCFWFFAKYGGSKTTNIVLAKSMPMRSAPTDFTLLRYTPTDFTDLHRLSGCVVSPTEFTEFTEVWCKKIPQISLCWDVLPQISQIYTELSCWEKFREICGFCGKYTHPNICEDLLSMLKSKCFDHYFHFKLRFYIQGWMFGDF